METPNLRAAVEQAIAEVTQTCFRFQDVMPSTKLIDLGLDSLSLLEGLALLEETIGNDLPAGLLDQLAEGAELDTIADLCDRMGIDLTGTTPTDAAFNRS